MLRCFTPHGGISNRLLPLFLQQHAAYLRGPVHQQSDLMRCHCVTSSVHDVTGSASTTQLQVGFGIYSQLICTVHGSRHLRSLWAFSLQQPQCSKTLQQMAGLIYPLGSSRYGDLLEPSLLIIRTVGILEFRDSRCQSSCGIIFADIA